MIAMKSSYRPWLDESLPLVTSRRGFFWVGGERVTLPFGTVAAGAMYVSWETPSEVRHPHPVVMVHGGGGQGTDWSGTPDGRPGWAPMLVEAGYTVFVVDRPGFGRSPLYPGALGQIRPPLTYETFEWLFGRSEEGPVPNPGATRHTAWPGCGDRDDPVIDQLMASFGPSLDDGAEAQLREQTCLVDLMDRIGSAIVVTHSAGGPAGWLAADARPDLVTALVAVEPLGPPFLQEPGGASGLTWGISAAPLRYDPAPADPGELGDEPRRLPNLARVPIAVVSAEASPLGQLQATNVQFLREAGCTVEHLELAEHGVDGCGHGLIFESNNRESLRVVTDWLESYDASDADRGRL